MKNLLQILFPTAIAAAQLTAWSAEDDGFKPIFNGKDLDGWDGNPKFWSVRDGAITGQTTSDNPTPHNTFLIWRHGALDDFELRLSFRIVGGNSGIQYRSKELPDWVVGGYQADFEAGKTYSGILYEERGRGILAQRGQKTAVGENGKPEATGSVGNSEEIQAAIKPEQWNDYIIIARGNHLIHKINDRVAVDVTDNDTKRRASTGLLAFQVHQGPPMLVQFKDIRLKRLPLDGKKKLVLVAGRPSHAPGEHEHNAGVQLLHQCLQNEPRVLSTFYLNGWPKDPTAFDNADTILFYADGGAGHPAIQDKHLDMLRDRMNKGAGMVNIHYAVEVPKDKGGPEFLEWTGGYFEMYWSVNPHWDADFKELPVHPITRGVKPFKIRDEWYYHMRFPEGLRGVTPILTAVPPDNTRGRPGQNDPHGGNPHVQARKGMPEHVAWACVRPNGGRGFGFTGAHFHKNWANDDFRKLVLNALLWTGQVEVPENGVDSVVTPEDLAKNLDKKGR